MILFFVWFTFLIVCVFLACCLYLVLNKHTISSPQNLLLLFPKPSLAVFFLNEKIENYKRILVSMQLHFSRLISSFLCVYFFSLFTNIETMLSFFLSSEIQKEIERAISASVVSSWLDYNFNPPPAAWSIFPLADITLSHQRWFLSSKFSPKIAFE